MKTQEQFAEEILEQCQNGASISDLMTILEEYRCQLESLVKQGTPSTDESTDGTPINFEFSELTKAKKNELILGAIDNVLNPKRDVTFEQADWLRFTSYLRRKGWYITKF